uniref:Cullin family profile domain-containing protein n=1 Tax=Spongospora subterranea TaxID=70186 RepID=A0A0H5R7I1_9EUKA|eukprot:CRZ09776.1 hypothetical protein [Spongospora subterranea]
MLAYNEVVPASRQSDVYSRKVIPRDQGWRTLVSSFEAFAANSSTGSVHVNGHDLINSYTLVYDMCMQGHDYAHYLYHRVDPLISGWLTNDVLRRHHYGPILARFSLVINEFNAARKYLSTVFKYLDKFHVVRESLLTISGLCLSSFYTSVFNDIGGDAVAACLSESELFRKGILTEKSVRRSNNVPFLSNIANLLVEFDQREASDSSIYESLLETPLLLAAQNQYSPQFVKDLLIGAGTLSYLQRVSFILSAEKSFASQWLQPRTIERLDQFLQKVLLVDVFTFVLGNEEGFKFMLNSQQQDGLSIAYQLYHQHPTCLENLAMVYQNNITEMKRQVQPKSPDYIPQLIELYATETSMIRSLFQDSIRFHRALHHGLEQVLDVSADSAQLLSKHLDNILSTSSSPVRDEDLSPVVALIYCLHREKEVFALHYRLALAVRLLSRRYQSDFSDRLVVSKLQRIFGSGFTHKMEVMISDIFKDAPLTTTSSSIEFTARILTNGAWPPSINADKALVIPASILPGLTAIELQYSRITTGRRLSWLHSASTCTLIGRCFQGQPQIELSSLQALILLLFNTNDAILISDLPGLTGASVQSIKRALRLMCTGKYLIISKDPVQGYSSTDKLSVNERFVTNERSIRIPFFVDASTNDRDLTKSIAVIKEDRKHVVEACIVRVVKHAKSIAIGDLIDSVNTKMAAYPYSDGISIKALVEDLVIREYLYRDRNNPELFHYNNE